MDDDEERKETPAARFVAAFSLIGSGALVVLGPLFAWLHARSAPPSAPGGAAAAVSSEHAPGDAPPSGAAPQEGPTPR